MTAKIRVYHCPLMLLPSHSTSSMGLLQLVLKTVHWQFAIFANDSGAVQRLILCLAANYVLFLNGLKLIIIEIVKKFSSLDNYGILHTDINSKSENIRKTFDATYNKI